MFFSLISILYPIWVIKNPAFHTHRSKSVITSIDLDLCVSNNNTSNNDKFVFIKKIKNSTDGFDLSKNNSFVAETAELRKIANYFRKLKQLNLLNSPLVSNECKLNCAQEVLAEAKENDNNKIKNNGFWETYEDIFF